MGERTARVLAPAKINLALHITGKRADGMHELCSLVAFADFGDELCIRKSKRREIKVTGEFAAHISAEDNSLHHALGWFNGRYGLESEFEISLEKRIPIMAGLGGGSADCAALLRFLFQYHHIDPPPLQELAELGADVPVCFFAGTCRMRGIGEVISPAALDRSYYCVLINPGIALSTRDVFDGFARADASLRSLGEFPAGEFECERILSLRNDLEEAATRLAPEIADYLEQLRAHAPIMARMSGSGSTCFALFDDEPSAQNCASALHDALPDAWIRLTMIG